MDAYLIRVIGLGLLGGIVTMVVIKYILVGLGAYNVHNIYTLLGH